MYVVVFIYSIKKKDCDEFLSFFKMYTYETLTPFQLKHEFTMVVAGPSNSGKTEFVKKLVEILIGSPHHPNKSSGTG